MYVEEVSLYFLGGEPIPYIGLVPIEPWLFFFDFQDHNGEDHAIKMQPGDLVWYESASVVHGRPYPMSGRSYDNVFIVFKPKGHWYR